MMTSTAMMIAIQGGPLSMLLPFYDAPFNPGTDLLADPLRKEEPQ
jgi:hypothetical protein